MVIDQKLLIEALERERDELLKNYPELAEYQKIIDQNLKGISDPFERAAILNQMLIKKMTEELMPAMKALRDLESEVKISTYDESNKKPA